MRGLANVKTRVSESHVLVIIRNILMLSSASKKCTNQRSEINLIYFRSRLQLSEIVTPCSLVVDYKLSYFWLLVPKNSMPYWLEIFHLLVCSIATMGSPLWHFGDKALVLCHGHLDPYRRNWSAVLKTLVTYHPLTMCNTPEGWAPQLHCSHSPKSHILYTGLSVTHTGKGCIPSSVPQTLIDQCSTQVMAASTPHFLGTWTELIAICCSTCILPSFTLQWHQ